MTKSDAASPEHPLITIPARQGAVAWLNAALASGQDKERPILYRTLSLEFYRHGVQFVGCDGTALIRTFVPSFEGAVWPELDEAPQRALIVSDADHFAAAFMRIIVQVTSDEAHQAEPLSVSTVATDDEASPALGLVFQRERFLLRACGQRLDLPLMEAQYPKWRSLNLGLEGERTKELRIATRLLGMLGKLKAMLSLDLQFHGAEKFIGFTGKGLVEVRGLLMPMRKVDAEEPIPPALAEAVANLAPEPGSGIESVTISGGGQSATLRQGDGDRIRKKAGLPAKKKGKKR